MTISSTRITSIPALLLLPAVLLLAGCGSSDSSSTATTTTTTATKPSAGAGGGSLEINMDDFVFKPKNATADAGKTTISTTNEGAVEHEMVLFRTDMNPAKLPTERDGSVDEEKLDEIAEEAGEIPDVEAGDSKSESFDLKPGRYVMFCNLPGHYKAGMYGTVTVAR
jgi:uncharacterized cupredoxin-like copper-binding protein